MSDGIEPALRALLEARAVRLARPAEADLADRTRSGALVFELGKTRLAAPLSLVQEVIAVPRLTPVPLAATYLFGLLTLRATVLPGVDLATLLNLPHRLFDRSAALVCGTGADRIAFLVGRVIDLQVTDLASLRPLPVGVPRELQAVVLGLTGEDVAVLDLARILADPRLVFTPTGGW